MEKDLTNVIITFGLVALVFTQGSFAYKDKVKQDVLLSKIEELSKKKNNNVFVQEVKKVQNTQNQITSQISKNQTSTANQSTVQAQIDLAKKEAMLKAEQQAQADQLAKQQALLKAQQQAQAIAQQQAQTQTTTTKRSRQSSAS